MSNNRPRTKPAARSGVPVRPSKKRRPPKRRGRRSRKPVLAAIIAVTAAAVVAVIVVATGGTSSHRSGPPGPEGVTLESGPALAAAGAVPPAQGAAGFSVQCGATEQLATHIHSHLAVFVNGQPRSIPLGVGFYGKVQITQSPQGPFAAGTSDCLYWLHAHASDGIIHAEGPGGQTFVLAQFFAIWGQPLTATQVGPAKGAITAYINGHRYTDPIQNITLTSHEAIQLDVGTPIVPPQPVSFASL